MRNKAANLLFVLAALMLAAGAAIWSFAEYTTPDIFKVIYGKYCAASGKIYDMGSSKYMIHNGYTTEKSFSRFVEEFGGEGLKKDTDGVTEYWCFSDGGIEKRIDTLVMNDSFIIIEITDE